MKKKGVLDVLGRILHRTSQTYMKGAAYYYYHNIKINVVVVAQQVLLKYVGRARQ